MLVGIMLLSTNSIDLVLDDGVLVDGFVNETIILDTWETTLNPDRYYGYTEDGDRFYMIISNDVIKLKIWTDDGKIRIVEPLI